MTPSSTTKVEGKFEGTSFNITMLGQGGDDRD